VVTEPEEDLYSGWGEAEDLKEPDEWVLEELEERDDDEARGRKKKGKKKRARRGPEEDWNAWDGEARPRPRRR
jgi:hypothetical protein